MSNWTFRYFTINSNINGYKVDNFLIPRLDLGVQLRISELVKEVVETKRINNLTDTSAIEKRIDEFVYQAYVLSEDDIKITSKAFKYDNSLLNAGYCI